MNKNTGTLVKDQCQGQTIFVKRVIIQKIIFDLSNLFHNMAFSPPAFLLQLFFMAYSLKVQVKIQFNTASSVLVKIVATVIVCVIRDFNFFL